MATSSQILSVFEQFCKEYKLHFHQIDEGIFTTNVRGNNGRLEVKCYMSDKYLLFYSRLPIIVLPEKQLAMLEFLNMVNLGRIVSSFELDLKSGDVSLRTGINLVDVQVTPNTLYQLLRENIGIADHYLKGIYQVTYGDMQPSIALRKLTKIEEEVAEDDEALRDLLNDPDLDQVLGNADD